MRSPSSLIFLVLLGVWAAYFVQYWVRRRDHVATARSVEQFSAAMRVLERRDTLPRTDLSEPAARSYAVHPGRAARPQVLVKRAAASDPTPDAATDPVRRAAPAGGTRPRLRVRPSRRVRGLVLLASLVGVLVVVPLTVLSLLPVWAPAPAVLAVAVALLWVRSGVRTEAALVRAHRRRAADLARVRSSAPVAGRAAGAAPRSSARPAPVVAETPVAAESVESTESVEPSVVAESHVGAEQAVPAGAATPDRVAVPATASVAPAPADDVMVPIVDDDDIPLTWDPVPVPRPTYTMKARAQRPEVAPAAVTPDPAPVARDDDSAATAYDERRVAGA